MLNNFSAGDGESSLARLLRDPGLGVHRRTVPSGTTLHEAGATADNLFLIQSGQIRLYQHSPDGSRRLLDISGPGHWLSVESVGAPTYSCYAEAASDTVVLVVPTQRLLSALPQHPQISLQLIRQLADQVNAATEDACGLVFDDCKRRLLKTLLKFSHSAAATATHDGVLLRMTHEQLAQAVGAARETVTLVLTELRNAKMVQTGRNKLLFQPQALFSALNEDSAQYAMRAGQC